MTCCVAPVYLWFQETSIELVVIEDDGNVQSVCDQPVFGTIKDLAILPWNEKFRARDPQVCCSFFVLCFLRNPLYVSVLIRWSYLLLWVDCFYMPRLVLFSPLYWFCSYGVKTFWFLHLILGSFRCSRFAMKCTGLHALFLSLVFCTGLVYDVMVECFQCLVH